ncbi:MAG TPA: aspartate kinase, partial [Candidatus Sulfopaludibacter sp.]|nr:aspartate kinase [Candidatus Sulfopaludibacter sp.]
MTNGLLVMKFGGTSMGSAERICIAADICREQRALRPVLAVVSAMAGVTDLLLNTLRHAEGGDEARIETNVEQLRERHLGTCRELGIEESAGRGVRDLIADFARLANGMLMLGDRPPRSVDEAIAIGERLTALMLAEYLESKKIPARAINGADVIVTDAVFGNATPIMEATRKKAQEMVKRLLDAGTIPVVTGF